NSNCFASRVRGVRKVKRPHMAAMLTQGYKSRVGPHKINNESKRSGADPRIPGRRRMPILKKLGKRRYRIAFVMDKFHCDLLYSGPFGPIINDTAGYFCSCEKLFFVVRDIVRDVTDIFDAKKRVNRFRS